MVRDFASAASFASADTKTTGNSEAGADANDSSDANADANGRSKTARQDAKDAKDAKSPSLSECWRPVKARWARFPRASRRAFAVGPLLRCPTAARMESSMRLLDRGSIEMSIDLRRGNPGVAAKLLHRPYVATAFQEVGCEAVAQHVRMHLLADLPPVFAHKVKDDRSNRLPERVKNTQGGSVLRRASRGRWYLK